MTLFGCSKEEGEYKILHCDICNTEVKATGDDMRMDEDWAIYCPKCYDEYLKEDIDKILNQ